MRTRRNTIRRNTLWTAATAGLAVLLLGGCGSPGSSGSSPSSSSSSAAAGAAAECAPEAGAQLVVLADDKHLQTVDNIIAAANAKAVQDDENVLSVLNTVSDTLTTGKLIALNKAVDVERKTSAQAATAFVAAESLGAQDKVGEGRKIVVGAANFSESATLAAIYAEVLTSAGYRTSIQTLDTRETYLPALESGKITVFPEYVGTLTEFLNKDINGPNATAKASGDLDATVSALRDLGKQRGLVFGAPSAAQDQNAFAVTKAFADKHKVSTLTELAAACRGLILGAGPECTERPFCQPGLEQTYGLEFAEFKALDVGGPLTKAALRKGTISLGLVFSSDGQLG